MAGSLRVLRCLSNFNDMFYKIRFGFAIVETEEMSGIGLARIRLLIIFTTRLRCHVCGVILRCQRVFSIQPGILISGLNAIILSDPALSGSHPAKKSTDKGGAETIKLP